MKDTNMKKEVLDFIIYLIKCTKDGKQNYDDLEDWSINGSAKYLLAQVIRQLKIPDCNIFISRNAWERWKSLTDDNIMRKFYKDQVRAKIDCKLEQYIGNKKEPSNYKSVNSGNCFSFNDVFHDEHIIPIKIIIDQLCALSESDLTYENVEKILKKICLCKILKSEDRNIIHKFNRANNIEEILTSDYNKITLLTHTELK